MQAEAEEFYFCHYCKHFGRDCYRDALAIIPSLMIWDDHDIFDGWGSYPTKMLNCDVMQVGASLSVLLPLLPLKTPASFFYGCMSACGCELYT